MRRLSAAAGAVCAGFLLGLVSAPTVFAHAPQWAGGSSSVESTDSAVGAADPADRQHSTAPVTAASPAATHTPSPTPSAEQSPSPKESETDRSAPGEQADARAGVEGRDIPDSAGGTLQTVSGSSEAPDQGADRVLSLRVEVEQGLPIDGQAFAEFAMTTLNDPRSWSADGVSFGRTDGEADFRLLLVSPEKVDELCAPLRTLGRYSCANQGRAVINARRYVGATEEFLAEGTAAQYRHYVINHEVGHLLGHDHRQCPGAGRRAPVMQQQTISLDGCEPNGWPHPEA